MSVGGEPGSEKGSWGGNWISSELQEGGFYGFDAALRRYAVLPTHASSTVVNRRITTS